MHSPLSKFKKTCFSIGLFCHSVKYFKPLKNVCGTSFFVTDALQADQFQPIVLYHISAFWHSVIPKENMQFLLSIFSCLFRPLFLSVSFQKNGRKFIVGSYFFVRIRAWKNQFVLSSSHFGHAISDFRKDPLQK